MRCLLLSYPLMYISVRDSLVTIHTSVEQGNIHYHLYCESNLITITQVQSKHTYVMKNAGKQWTFFKEKALVFCWQLSQTVLFCGPKLVKPLHSTLIPIVIPLRNYFYLIDWLRNYFWKMKYGLNFGHFKWKLTIVSQWKQFPQCSFDWWVLANWKSSNKNTRSFQNRKGNTCALCTEMD